MQNPSPTVRRRAWISSHRQWLSLEELDPEEMPCNLPSASLADDDVFSDGCTKGKIVSWLLGCGSKACSEISSQLIFRSVLKTNRSEDELSLGADAAAINVGENTPDTGTSHQALCLPLMKSGCSMASSCLSSSTCKSATSSLSEILQLCSEDAEETLYELGFGCDEPQVTVRIPPRFFTFPSLARGINLRLFLDSQLQRIREEDPSLCLASRFRQVQVLTAMANAFYSLYSHVSRTPLQKLAPPEFSFSSSPVERIERFRSSVRSEPRSPVERLKDTVSKMCLYTGSPRGSDSTSPQPSPKKRASVPNVADLVLEKVKSRATKRLDLKGYNRSKSAVVVNLITDGDGCCDRGREDKQAQQSATYTDAPHNGNQICHEETQGSKPTDGVHVDKGHVKAAGLDSETPGVRTSLSEDSVTETNNQFLSRQPELGSCSTQSETSNAQLKPAAKVAYDLIYPQIAECVEQVPFCTINPKICSETEHIDKPCAGPHAQSDDSEYDEDSHSAVTRPLPALASNDCFTSCCVTVTYCEGDDISTPSQKAPDSSHTSTVPPVQTCEESFNEEKSRYLNPSTRHQVNSFELEEVQSAGEDDSGQLETARLTFLSSRKCQHKGEVVRADSMQSDSSGYADEESNLSYRT